MKIILRLTVLFSLFLCQNVFPEDQPLIKVKTEIGSKKVYIGDEVKYSISIWLPNDAEAKQPEFKEEFKGFSTKDFGVEVNNYFKKKVTYWYIFDTYTTGSFTIPKAKVQYKKKGQDEWQEKETEEVTFTVESLLSQGQAKDIRDIKGVVSEKSFIWLAVLVLLLFLAGGVMIYYKFFFHRRQEQKVIFKKPAYQIALERLAELEAKHLPLQGKIKEYYIELSNIIRYYIEDRFLIRAPEMTTEEFLFYIKERKELSLEHKSSLKEFLSASDMVKFAKYGPDNEEIEKSFVTASNFIEKTKELEETKKEKIKEDDF